nr:immunoglobulin heavy chain junction region [Macaca mulatta]MOY19641.1 immunoglobulin heavy chain junction region [Macaca mulatta]
CARHRRWLFDSW